MKHRFSEINVSKVAGTFGHITGTGLTTGLSVDDTLSGIHETAELWAPRFHSFWEADATFGDGHTSLKKKEDTLIKTILLKIFDGMSDFSAFLVSSFKVKDQCLILTKI